MGKCEIFKSFRGSAPDPTGGLQRPPPQTPSWKRAVLCTACLASQDLLLSFFHILRASAGPVSFSLPRPCDQLTKRELSIVAEINRLHAQLRRQEQQSQPPPPGAPFCSVLTLCTSFWQSLILCTSLWQAILYWHASIFLYVCIQPFSLK